VKVQASHQSGAFQSVDRLPHKPRERRADNFAGQNAAHWQASKATLAHMWIGLPTGWG
jgi:hypothetical protein